MTIALVSQDKDLSPWFDAFRQNFPDIKVIDALSEFSFSASLNSNDDNDLANEVTCAVVWKPPSGYLQRFPNLNLIVSMGAGVDHIFTDEHLNRQIPITRLVDSHLAEDMNEYLLSVVLNHNRHIGDYQQSQSMQNWQPQAYKSLSETHIGVLGLGQLGLAAAQYFKTLGCEVSGWSRTQKNVAGIHCYFGLEQLPRMLGLTDVIICLLPLTPATRGVINKDSLRHMKRHAYTINVSRGELVDEDALLEALDEGHLSGACLDVFAEEPLPKDHPFWRHKKILVTPHVASLTRPASVIPQIVDNYHRAIRGESLVNRVDPNLEY